MATQKLHLTLLTP